MKRGPTTAKECFEIRLRLAIEREFRRRKTGKYVVLSHVIRVCNSMRAGNGHTWAWKNVEVKT